MARSLPKQILCLLLITIGTGCSPIVESYEAVTVGPHAFSGVHDPDEDYLVGLLLCNVSLKPVKVSAVGGTGGNFFNTVSGQFPIAAGWSYQSAAQALSRRTLEIKTYDAQGSALSVGADVHIRYRPTRSDPAANIHWIQVVSNNHKLSTNVHGDNDNKVDIVAGQADPYYDTNGLADSGTCAPACNFYDKPRRPDPGMDHAWDAVLFLAEAPSGSGTPGNIRFIEPGMSWGWQNACVPLEIPGLRYFWNLIGTADLIGGAPLQPGRRDTLILNEPASFRVQRGDQQSEVDLLEFNIVVEVQTALEPSISPEADLWNFKIVQGQGVFAAVDIGDNVLPQTPFRVLEGQGIIQPAGGGVSAQLQLQFTPADQPQFAATALLYGRLDPEGVLSLGPGTQIVEDEAQ